MPWVSNLINIGGWTGLVTVTWKVAQRFFAFNEKINKTEETVIALASNHIPHIQIELEKANQITEEGFDRMAAAVQGLRSDISDAVTGLRTDLMIIATKK